MRFFRPLLLLLLASLCGLSTAQSVALTKLEAVTTGFVIEEPLHPRFVSSVEAHVSFLPVPFLRLDGGFTLLIPETARFFHPVQESNIPGELTFEAAAFSWLTHEGRLQTGIFTGYLDDCASDRLLRTYLKKTMPGAEFRDTLPGQSFVPATEIRGTGLFVSGAAAESPFASALYVHWNTVPGNEAVFSADLRNSGSAAAIVYNLFYGISVPVATITPLHRAGIGALLGSGTGSELYGEFGISRYETGESDIAKKMYFLFEPRLKGKHTDFSLAFFALPVFPENMPLNLPAEAQGSYVGLNTIFSVGKLEKEQWRVGLSGLTTFNPEEPGAVTPFSLAVTPFINKMISDFLLDARISIRPLSGGESWSMFECQLSFKAVY